MLRQNLEEEELKECTFTPHVNNSGSTRTLDEFLMDQQRFIKNKLNYSSSYKELTAVPKINDKSSLMVPQKQRKVHERLYMMHKKPLMIEEDEKLPVKTTREKRELKLYQLAMEKKAKKESHVKEQPVKIEPSEDPILIQGFRKEFARAVDNIDLFEEKKINLKGMEKILRAMHLTKESEFESLNNRTNELTRKLWSILKLPDQELILISILELYIAAILNIKLKNLDNDNPSSNFKRTFTNKEILNYFPSDALN